MLVVGCVYAPVASVVGDVVLCWLIWVVTILEWLVAMRRGSEAVKSRCFVVVVENRVVESVPRMLLLWLVSLVDSALGGSSLYIDVEMELLAGSRGIPIPETTCVK